MTIAALPEPLEKEIAYPGTFVDAYGNRVKVTRELCAQALEGTRQLIEAGFKIRGFTSHFTDDSKDVVGTWPCLYLLEKGSLRGVIQPRNEEMRQLALGLDTSMVIEEDVQLPNGVVVPIAITRVDIVPQGAIVGTEPFAEFVRSRPAAVALSRRVLLAAACEEKSMKGSMMRALAAALGMDVAGELNEEVIEKAVVDQLGLAEASDEEKEQALAKAFGKAFMEGMPEESEEPASMSDEAPAPADNQEAAAPKGENAEMSALSRRIAKLEDDKVTSLVAGLKAEDKKRVMSRFSAIRAASDFDLAYDTVSDLVSAMTKTDPVTAALSNAAGGSRGTAADTPRRTNTRGKDAQEEEAKKRLIAAMQRRLGSQPQAQA